MCATPGCFQSLELTVQSTGVSPARATVSRTRGDHPPLGARNSRGACPTTSVINLGICTAARVLRRPAPTFAASRSGLRRAIVTQSLSWIISGHHLWLLAVVAGAPPGRAYPLCVAGFALATVAGLVVMVAPDGIGVREGVLALALATVLPLPLAGTVVLASRIVSVLSDVVVGAGGLLLAEYLHRRACPTGRVA